MHGLAFLIPLVGVFAACFALGASRASYYRSRKPRPAPKPRPKPARALSDIERALVLSTLNSDAFMDKAPAQVFAKLLEDGMYVCSTRTMYRMLAANDEVRERRDQRQHPAYTKPQLVATAPNQVWSWDTTKLPGPTKGTYFTLYLILDLFSRYIVGWQVAARESAAVAQQLIDACCKRQGVTHGQLTIHADRGSPMTAKSTALLYVDLGIAKSHSRRGPDTGRLLGLGLCDRIFEPFFTTKAPGVGTGLGLPVSRAVVQRHRGVLEVREHNGRTAFVIEFPAVGTSPQKHQRVRYDSRAFFSR